MNNEAKEVTLKCNNNCRKNTNVNRKSYWSSMHRAQQCKRIKRTKWNTKGRENWKKNMMHTYIDFYRNDCMVKIYIFSRRMRNEIASCSRRVLTSVNITECTIFHTVQVHAHTGIHTNIHIDKRAWIRVHDKANSMSSLKKDSCAHCSSK